jgi:arginine/lysine/ornithine decarboxylase
MFEFQPSAATERTHLRKAVEALHAISRYDHSLSVPELGSLFHEDTSPLAPVGDIPQRHRGKSSNCAERGDGEAITAVGALQQGIADVYDVPFAWPSTNGTTPLNVMALITVAPPSSRILVQRDCHVSVLAALIQADLTPIYLCPDYDPALGLLLGPTAAQVQTCLDGAPDVAAALLTYPNYFGIASDIEACAGVLAERNIPLVIDAAHGAHLRFHPALPLPAERTSAAIITHSTHKTLSALSQGSVALLNDLRYKDRWYETINQLGYVSTSFSYPILLSIGVAVWQFQVQGAALLDVAIAASQETRAAINEIAGLRCLAFDQERPGFHALDPLRLTVDVSGLGATGYDVARCLREQFHIYPELATRQHLLFLVGAGDDHQACFRIVAALQTLAAQLWDTGPVSPQPTEDGQTGGPLSKHLTAEHGRHAEASRWQRHHDAALLAPPAVPRQLLRPREAFYLYHQQRRRVPLAAAIGYPSAETIAAYPPGSAVIVAGEEVTPEVVAFLQAVRRAGGTLKGASDPTCTSIQIITL